MNLLFSPEVIILFVIYMSVKMVLQIKGKTTDCGSLENRVLWTIFGHKGKEIMGD
jgi:hypothetical protein